MILTTQLGISRVGTLLAALPIRAFSTLAISSIDMTSPDTAMNRSPFAAGSVNPAGSFRPALGPDFSSDPAGPGISTNCFAEHARPSPLGRSRSPTLSIRSETACRFAPRQAPNYLCNGCQRAASRCIVKVTANHGALPFVVAPPVALQRRSAHMARTNVSVFHDFRWITALGWFLRLPCLSLCRQYSSARRVLPRSISPSRIARSECASRSASSL